MLVISFETCHVPLRCLPSAKIGCTLFHCIHAWAWEGEMERARICAHLWVSSTLRCMLTFEMLMMTSWTKGSFATYQYEKDTSAFEGSYLGMTQWSNLCVPCTPKTSFYHFQHQRHARVSCKTTLTCCLSNQPSRNACYIHVHVHVHVRARVRVRVRGLNSA